MRPGPGRAEPAPPRAALLLGVLAVVAASFAAYGPVLDNYFLEIDDPTLLYAIEHGGSSTPHFRPLYLAWNRLLHALFGTDPFPYYLAGILLHAASAALVLGLVRSLTGKLAPAVVAGLTFAVLYSPHEIVFYISANCGLLSVLLVLLSACAWLHFLRTGRRWAALAALVSLAGAMGSKEDSVLAGPLLVGIHVVVGGWRGLLAPRAIRSYLPFLALAAVYLALAFRPSLWADRPGVGQYALTASLVPDLFQNFVRLLWPRSFQAEGFTGVTLALGVALVLGLFLLAARLRSRGALIGLGLAVALFGLLPTLPGPLPVAGTRYAYPSAIGVALLAAGLWHGYSSLAGEAFRTRTRHLLALGFAGWIVVQVMSIHSVEQWRFEPKCERLRMLVESTRSRVLPELRADREEVLVLSPPIWNAHDYRHAVVALLGHPADAVRASWVPWRDVAEELEPGGPLDPAARRIFTARGDGVLYRLESAGGAPLALWESLADDNLQRGNGLRLAVFTFSPPAAPLR